MSSTHPTPANTGRHVPDEHVTALRAYLSGDVEGWERLHGQLLESGRLEGYGQLIHAAFVTAVRRRFSKGWAPSVVIQYVAEIRALASERPGLIDPRAAESLIRQALDDPVAHDTAPDTQARTELLLLMTLIEDEDLDDEGLDQFLDIVRRLTENWWPT